jgi:hypothetical protein
MRLILGFALAFAIERSAVGQDSISGAERTSRLAAGGCDERGLHRGRASARATNSFFS